MGRILTLEEIQNEWSQDSKIDLTKLDVENSKIGSLHSKYATQQAHHSLLAKKKTSEYNKLRAAKHEYYDGTMSKEELDDHGWRPWPGRHNKEGIARQLEKDDDLNTLLLTIALHEETANFCMAVVKELNSRTYQIGNTIKWIAYMRGIT